MFVILASTQLTLTAQSRLRVLVLTDIENEPDDAQSMVRFLTYSNEWDVEGFVATTSIWQQNKIADWRLHEIVDAYGRVRDNLEKHQQGYPSHEFLKDLIKKGLPKFGMQGVGSGQDSEGSDWVISVMDKQDPRPVWILAWGGTNVLAQALWKMQRTKAPGELEKIISKMRVYTISDQDDSAPWIRKSFPGLFYIVSPGFQENGGGGYHYATWPGISGDKFHGMFPGADFNIVDNPWLDRNVRQDHGPLGTQYPQTEYIMEGDTPSFLYLIPNGLGDPEHPNYGSWGGRYELYIPHLKKWFYEAETRPIWSDALDVVHSKHDNYQHTSNHATIWRWREAYQNDFAARMDWNVKSPGEANHPPEARLGHPNELMVFSGDTVKLNASNSSDPDKDKLSYEWIFYPEAGSYRGQIELQEKLPITESKRVNDQRQNGEVWFIAPPVEKGETIHVVVAVSDNGEPVLTRYQRVIINVLPK